MDKPRSFAPIIAAVLLLLPVLYVGSYLALVVPEGKPADRVFRENGHTVIETYLTPYRFGGKFSERIYWPLEQIDRRVRQDAWESVTDSR
jgi:hypothetical protein